MREKTYHAGQPPLRDDSNAMRSFSDDEGAVARVVASDELAGTRSDDAKPAATVDEFFNFVCGRYPIVAGLLFPRKKVT